MGCDIHMVIEVKKYDDDDDGEHWGDPAYLQWVCVAKQDVTYAWRNYRVFGILAGVRDSDVTPISPPRGLPPDISPEAKKEIEEHANHSYSYLSLDEVKAYKWDPETCEPFIAWLESLRWTRLDYVSNEARLVFGFDS